MIAGQASGEHFVFSVADFGAIGDGQADDRAAIQTAIDAACAAGDPAVVRFNSGCIYRLGRNAESVAALQFSNASKVALEGNGCMLVAHPSNRVLSIFESRDIRISGFKIDYDPLPYAQGRIVSIETSSVVFEVDDGYPEPREGDSDLYANHPRSDCVFLDGRTRKFSHAWQRMSKVERIKGNRFRIHFYPGAHPRRALLKPGDFIVAKIRYEQPSCPQTDSGRFLATGAGNIQIAFSENIRVADIESYAAPVMTLVAHGSENVQVDGLRVVRKPGTDRLVASCSDGAHMKSLTVMPRLTNCRFEALMDDSINIKVSAQKVLKIQGKRVLMTHCDILWNDIVLKPGDELEFTDSAETRFLDLAKVMAFRKTNYQEAWVTLDDVPRELQVGDLAYIRPQTMAVVSNCTFRSQLKTALVTRPQTQVENCSFEGLAHGVHAMLWGGIEGPAPRGINIQNCTFGNLWISAVEIGVNRFEVVPPGLPGIVIKDCRMELDSEAVAVGGRTPELLVDNMHIKTEGSRSEKRLFPIKTGKRSLKNISIE
ncbi:MAG: glycosyl hydrolase family 28-related protein [Verrucomicrobiota bacterium]